MPPENDLCCTYQQTAKVRGRPYLQRCSKEPGHPGMHYLRPAHHIAWELDRKVFMPGMMRILPLQFVMRPYDGNWLNLEPKNWEITTREKINSETARARSGQQFKTGWKKCCVTCDEWKLDSAFDRKRNECKDCFRLRSRKNVEGRKAHIDKYGCVLAAGLHYHLGRIGQGRNDLVFDYWMALRFDELRKDGPARVRRELERLQQLVEDDNGRRPKTRTSRARAE